MGLQVSESDIETLWWQYRERIIIVVKPAPRMDLFRAWKLPLCHIDKAKGKRYLQ